MCRTEKDCHVAERFSTELVSEGGEVEEYILRAQTARHTGSHLVPYPAFEGNHETVIALNLSEFERKRGQPWRT